MHKLSCNSLFNTIRSIVLLLLLSCTSQVSAQLTLDKTSYDFGDITENSNRTVDFYLVNHYQFSIILNSFFFDMEVNSVYTPTTVKPGDTLNYRVKIFPRKTGPFEKTIPLYFYNLSDTLSITLKANVLRTDFADKKRLEPFEEKAGRGEEPFKYFPVTFKILDESTHLPIPNASVSISAKSPQYKNTKSNEDGIFTREVNNRYTAYIYAYSYRSKQITFSVGCADSIRTVYLQKSSPGDKTEADYAYEYEGQNPIKADENLEPIDSTEEALILAPLDTKNYKPNNIVFLLDVSISMLDHDRINLLKTAITQLVKLMRPNDNISIITFSEDTKILINPTFLTELNRNSIINVVNQLKASGMTNGGKGLKLAFKLIQENFDPEKNNQVLLATDGALGAYMKHEDIVELVKHNATYTKTSVVTLSGYNWSKTFMREIAQAGNGKLIPINSTTEAKLLLVKDIKANSLITPTE